jgi:hypothetical protein
MNKKNIFNFKIIGVYFAAALAAIATFPYGYKFSYIFSIENHFLQMAVGGLLGTVAMLANMALGAYSLLKIDIKSNKTHAVYIFILSILGSIPLGFLCFFGYSSILPIIINIILSLVVIFVNTGINYTAINSLLKNLLGNKKNKFLHGRFVAKMVGFAIGICASSVSYLATAHGLSSLFISYNWSRATSQDLGVYLAIIAWLPFAALYSNATQLAGERLYGFFTQFKRSLKKISTVDILILLFSLLSGSAFAQMVIEFFNPAYYIPMWFKSSLIQLLVMPLLMPLTLLAAATVNYFALRGIIVAQKD